jgi:hypothetical protein
MQEIVYVHFPDLEKRLLKEVLARFYWLREIDDFRKKPSTSELLDWIQALLAGGIKPEIVAKELPFAGALIKKEQDMEILSAVASRPSSGRIGLRNRF